MNPFQTFLLTAQDYIKSPLNLLRSLLTPHGLHHTQTQVAPNENKKTSRKIYLTDLDDTFINWKVVERTAAWKKHHKFISRPSDEKIELFEGAEDFIKHLNKSGVHTGIVSNKSHEKLLSQAKHHPWGGLFDALIGHDRAHCFTMRKHAYNMPEILHYNNAQLPILAIEKLLGEKLKSGMEKIEVIFVGDRPNQDIATANALDSFLKKFNPQSACTSILFNSRDFTPEKIATLPTSQQPKEKTANYSDLQAITDKIFGLSKEKEIAKPAAEIPPKDWQKAVQIPPSSGRGFEH